MRVVEPTQLLAEAAEVLAPFHTDLVVVGAAAMEVALAGARGAAITPTRDVDAVVPVDRVDEIVAHLRAANLEPSEVPHERGFTWVRDTLKVQLVRTYHPFPKGAAKPLPANPVFGMAADPRNQYDVAFAADPDTVRLHTANAACLLALKEAAFGRTRGGDATSVERDFHDAYLLVSEIPDRLSAEYAIAPYEVRTRGGNAVKRLAEDSDAIASAARQMVLQGTAESQRSGEAAVRRDAIEMSARFGLDD